MLALKHPWSGARLIPMAANVQWLLYDCGDPEPAPLSTGAPPRISGLWVKMLHNEREVQFPPCMHHHSSLRQQHPSQRGGGGGSAAHNTAAQESGTSRPFGLHYPCPWEVVKDYFRKVAYPAHGIDTCDAEDWVRLCGGVGECADGGDD